MEIEGKKSVSDDEVCKGFLLTFPDFVTVATEESFHRYSPRRLNLTRRDVKEYRWSEQVHEMGFFGSYIEAVTPTTHLDARRLFKKPRGSGIYSMSQE